MKSYYPGDPDFALENYSSLPYPYVLQAYVKGMELYRERMHDLERPTAMVSSILANQGRDPKKTKAVTWEDFSMYKPVNGQNVANYVYGSSMMVLAKKRMLPSWALFCFKEVTATALDTYVPSEPALIAEDAMLLHPVQGGTSYKGMLIALESASEQFRVFKDSKGNEVILRVPHVHTKAIAQEDVILSL